METQILLNKAAISVSKLLKKKREGSSQLNQLLEVLSSRQGVEGIYAVQEHLVYQSGRILPKEFCKCVYQDLMEVIKSDEKDPARTARQYLNHIKRLFKGAEELDSIRIQNENSAFDEFARQVFAPSPERRERR
ncbi:MAG: hypothetical protein JW779_10440 [Candidatus Thorarchaeota archaeon]|nr:hypothetical protein [Candidatus Thorarchaeota archaeon]